MPLHKAPHCETILLIKSSFFSSAEPEITNKFVPDTDRELIEQGRKTHGWPTNNCEDNSLHLPS